MACLERVGISHIYLQTMKLVVASAGYDKVSEEAEFRRECAESVGVGFDVPAEIAKKPAVLTICTQNAEVMQVA